MPESGDQKTVDLVISSCAPTEGTYGMQWQLEVKLPFSNYPGKMWVEQSDFPNPIDNGNYRCIIERRGLKKDKDPSADFNWNWKIVKFDPDAAVTAPTRPQGPPPPMPPPHPNGTGPVRSREDDIRRAVAGKMATDVVCAYNITALIPRQIIELIKDFTAAFDAILSSDNAPTSPVGHVAETMDAIRGVVSGSYDTPDSDPHGLAIPPVEPGMLANQFSEWAAAANLTPATIKEALGSTAKDWVKQHKADGGRDAYSSCARAIVAALTHVAALTQPQAVEFDL